MKIGFPAIKIAIASLLFLSGCGMNSLPNDSASQLDYACEIINGWPVDYATMWPTAVEKHNESPEEVSAASYMQDFIQIMAEGFQITDIEPSQMIDSYKEYWGALEMDYMNNGGIMPTNAASTPIVSSLMKRCDELGRGISNEN